MDNKKIAYPGLVTALVYILLALFVLIVYPWIFRDAPYLAGDSPAYMKIAQDLADLSLDELHLRPPGYPLLLLLTGSTTKPTRLLFYVSLFLHIASFCMLGRVLYHRGFPVWWVGFFGAIMILPPFMEAAAQVITEVLAEFLLTFAFAMLVVWLKNRKSWTIMLAGAALAAASLVRPTFQLLSLPLAFMILLASYRFPGYIVRRNAWKAAAILFSFATSIIVAFGFFNFTKHGTFGIAPGMMAMSLSTKTVRVIERLPDEYQRERELMINGRNQDLVKRGSHHWGNQYLFRIYPQMMAETGLEGAEFYKRMMKLQLLLIAKAPITYLMEVLQSCVTFWFPWEQHLSGTGLIRIFWAFIQASWILFFLLQLIAFAGLVLMIVTRRLTRSTALFRLDGSEPLRTDLMIYVTGTIFILYTMVISCALNIGEPRYRAPLDPILICLCFIGARSWWRLNRLPMRTDQAVSFDRI